MGYSEISQLSFGKSIAESEEEALSDYFISTRAYVNAKNANQRKVFYVGHRGIGKSALLGRLAHDFGQDAMNIIVKITPDQFSYEMVKKVEHDFVDVRSVYAAVWHYTLITQLFRNIVSYYNKNNHLKTNRENVRRLNDYLIEKGFLERESVLGIFFEFLKEFTLNKITPILYGITPDLTTKHKQLERILNLSDLSKQLNALLNITDSHPIYLFIDELDTGWDNSKEAQNYLYGLFYAVSKIRKLRNVIVFVSLRSDMYQDLSAILPDPEKMRDDIERFSWNNIMLTSLIAKRIMAYWPNDELKNCTHDKAISTVFEEGLLDYIISHTLHRPREIIQFCNDALSEFGKLVYSDQTYQKINKDVVLDVEPAFSMNRLGDLCEEYKHQFPSLKKLLYCFENSPEYYSMDDFCSKLEESMYRIISPDVASWIEEYLDNPMRLAGILFNMGFIKLYSNKSQQYLAYYETPLFNIENVTQVKIHEAFLFALKCK